METHYTNEMNVLMTIALMKAHGIKQVVVSPGGTNVALATSLMNDKYFKLYSCVDERSAAYLACGLAEESCESVALCCTGATASRNYVPALTEAFYRKLPILVLTTSQHEGKVGQNFPQVTDRWQQMNDIVQYSTHIPCNIDGKMDHWSYNLRINEALLALKRNGGGPSHINLATESSTDFSVDLLPNERVIDRLEDGDTLPKITDKRIAVYVGNHKKMSQELIDYIDDFCRKYDAAVLCDNTSNYHGSFRVESCILSTQTQYTSPLLDIDLLIHIGDVSGSYMNLNPKCVWRVNPDGEVRDTFYKLRFVFQMREEEFFKVYANKDSRNELVEYAALLQSECERLRQNIPELPLSNAWLAQQTAPKLPKDSEIHFGILNSLRTWNAFHLDETIDCFCNTGGFGIDGCLSSAIGSSLVNSDRIYYCVLGDLAFFYDLNSLGNRHIGNNLRIIMINNGCGAEFHIPACVTKRAGMAREDINMFTGAYGHYGAQSETLVKHYAQDLGFRYLSIRTKEEYLDNLHEITSKEIGTKPLFVEVFTDVEDDSKSLEILTTLQKSTVGQAKQLAKSLLGAKNIERLKRTLKG